MLFNGSILADSSTSHDPPYSEDSIRHDHLDECGDTHLSISSKPPYTSASLNIRPEWNAGWKWLRLSHRRLPPQTVESA